MSASIRKRFIWLWITFFSLIGVGLYYWFFDKNSIPASSYYYKELVQKRVSEVITESTTDLANLELALQKNKPLPATTHPYIIYKDRRVYSWGILQEVMPYGVIQSLRTYDVLQQNGESYLITRKNLGNGYSLVSCVWIQNYSLTAEAGVGNGFNQKIFLLAPSTYHKGTPAANEFGVLSPDNHVLFSFGVPPIKKSTSTFVPIRTLRLLELTMLPFSIFVILQLMYWSRKRRYGRVMYLLGGWVLLIRYIFFSNQFLWIASKTKIFHLDGFPFEDYYHTIGNQYITFFAGFVIFGYLCIYLHRLSIFYNISRQGKLLRSGASVLSVVVPLFCTYIASRLLAGIYTETHYRLGYGLSLELGVKQLLPLAYYVLVSIIYFMIVHLASSFFNKIHGKKTREALLHWLYGTVLGSILLWVLGGLTWLTLATALLFLFLHYTRYPHYFYVFRYRTTIYLLLMSLFFNIIGVYVLVLQEHEKDLKGKIEFGRQFMAESPSLLEKELEALARQMKRDTALQEAIGAAILPRERVVELVNERYLMAYAGQYGSDIKVYGAAGQNLDILLNDDVLEKRNNDTTYLIETFKPHEGPAKLKIVQLTVPLLAPGLSSVLGTVVIRLNPNTLSSTAAAPEIVDRRFEKEPYKKDYSYAIMEGTQVVRQQGEVNYTPELLKTLETDARVYTEGVQIDGYSHTGMIDPATKRRYIISSPFRWLPLAMANLSYISFITSIFVAIALILNGIRYGASSRMRLNFTTRLQLFQSAAFIVPLLLVITFFITNVQSTFKGIQQQGFRDRIRNVASSVALLNQDLKAGIISKNYFEQEIKEMATDGQTDINLYDASGRLTYTTRPLLYNFEWSTPVMSSVALATLRSDNKTINIQDEELDAIPYTMVYKQLDTSPTHPYNIIGVPFFYADRTLATQLNSWVSSTISPFIFLFIILLGLSFLMARQLTLPLRMITSKINRTDLDKLNEPIIWRADDEIGLLTRAYNAMLVKLEENKTALSQSEKQTAWREMAKQVVHEIKNPLTPMKLSIQQLQRTISTKQEVPHERIERTLSSLTEQIDTISDIANSFSEFAKMPAPRIEGVELISVLQKTVDLYAENKLVEVRLYHSDTELTMQGDRQMLSRIVNNLIINGLQSAEDRPKAMVHVIVYRQTGSKSVIIEVKDNGEGIPESLRNRVFMPNFSTKVGGSGLGLAMARRGIEHMGGSIWFDTIVGEGTTFYIDLPLSN